jgi:hypothetical protein
MKISEVHPHLVPTPNPSLLEEDYCWTICNGDLCSYSMSSVFEILKPLNIVTEKLSSTEG